jgi:hypothetical protein
LREPGYIEKDYESLQNTLTYPYLSWTFSYIIYKKTNTSFGLVNVRGLADNFNPYDNITFVNISELKKSREY